MPSGYKRPKGSRTYQNYSEDTVREALGEITNGNMSARQASLKYKIPRQTLDKKAKGLHQKPVGRPTVFSAEQENKLSVCIMACADWGFPQMIIDIQLLLQSFLNSLHIKCTRFTNNCPGYFWVQGFMKRHPELSKRLCQNVKRSRACQTESTFQTYFEELDKSLRNIPAKAIVNYDETNFSDDPGQQFVLARRGSKHAERIVDSTRSSTSVMFAGAADGTFLDPYTVYQARA